MRRCADLQDRAAPTACRCSGWTRAGAGAGAGAAVHAALLSPTTGIVDSHGLMLALQGDLESAGGMVALGRQCSGAAVAARQRLARGCAWPTRSWSWPLAWSTRVAAGLRAGAALRGAGARSTCRASSSPRATTTRWRRAPFSRLVYPAPGRRAPGRAPDAGPGRPGQVRPDIEWLESTARGDRLPRSTRRGRGLLRRGAALLARAADGALHPATAACGPRSTARQAGATSASTGRPCTACRAW